MKRILAILITNLALLIGVGTTANAYTTYQSWRFKDSVVCITNNVTWFPAMGAARYWRTNNTSGLWLTSGPDCQASGFSRKQTVIVKVTKSTERYCARTGSENNSYTWEYVYINGVKTAMWTPNAMTITLNTYYWNGCWKTAGMRLHTAVHEEGHAIGLAHADPTGAKSVMIQGRYDILIPQYKDYRNLEKRY